MRFSVLVSATVAALVGFGGTLALILSAAKAAGADPAQATSWVTAICLATGAAGLILSLWSRLPIITAWSTPGAALIAASTVPGGMNAAVGAFLLAGALIVVTAAVKPIGDLIARIPASVAAAMLAGVLLRFVLAVFESAQASPALVLPLLGLFLVARLVSPAGGMLIVLLAGIALAFGLHLTSPLPDGLAFSTLVWITPRFEPATLVGLGLPLFIVTMASQNLPGFAVLRAAGYKPPVRPILAVTGLGSMLTAPFGAHTTNLAAITAAICTGPDTHPAPEKRWQAGVAYGLIYFVFAAFGASLVALFAAMPADLIKTIAGTALIGPLVGALGVALHDEKQRFAAVLTLAVTASGVSAFSIGSAFWGLAAGLLALLLDRIVPRRTV